ncbi:hypothetical protein [Streptomyces sp. NPDC058383]
MRYLGAGGITWRAMPGDFPVWERVYAFAALGCAGAAGRTARPAARPGTRGGRPRSGVNRRHRRLAVGTGRGHRARVLKGIHRGKKVPGHKRHIVVDCLGLLAGV